MTMKEVKTNIIIPKSIRKIVGNKKFVVDNVGMSGSTIMTYDNMVLKIEKHNYKTEKTINMMRWLDGKLPVPRVICHEIADGMSYLLMSRITGKMSCDKYYLERPDELVTLLAEGLKILWSVDVADCPRERTPDVELADARYNVENNLVDVNNVEPETFGEGGFESPMHLLKWLEENKPVCELVLSHGDYCLPNIFFENGKVSGFIDLGDTGVGDKWRDIALCYRSLRHNADGSYGGKAYDNVNPDMLFEKLGMEPDREKLRWYTLLDELF